MEEVRELERNAKVNFTRTAEKRDSTATKGRKEKEARGTQFSHLEREGKKADLLIGSFA